MFYILIAALIATLACARSLRGSANFDWMLTEEEITKSRTDYKREGISVFAEDNTAEVLLDGANFMGNLYDDILQTKRGDHIHATFFEEDVRVMLRPNSSDIEGSKKTNIYNIVKDALNRGVTIRFLVNYNLIQSVTSVYFCVTFNLLCGYTCCGIDRRHPNWILGNLHSKLWVVKHGNETVVYNGGMDVAKGRWDTSKHDNSAERRMNFNFLGATAVHDAIMRMTGPIAVDYERYFYQLWNDPYPAFFPFHWLPKYEWVEPQYTRNTANGLQIQLLRVAACKGTMSGYYQNFAPKGEISAFFALLKMIKKAKRFLYMEDQFFNYPDIFVAIKERLPSLEFVLILTNNQSTPALFSNERYYYQYQGMKHLKEDPELAKKVHIYQLVRDTAPDELIYIHSKLYIADDKFLIVGSFGVERVGLTNDLEVGVGVYDTKGKFVRDTRKKIWAEHLMTTPDDRRLDDPSEGLKLWIKEGEAANKRVRAYFPLNTGKTILSEAFYNVYESNGLCE